MMRGFASWVLCGLVVACSGSESSPAGGGGGATTSSTGGASGVGGASGGASGGATSSATTSSTTNGGTTNAGSTSSTTSAGGGGSGGGSGPGSGGGGAGRDASSDTGGGGSSSTDAAAEASGPCNPGPTWTIVDDYTYSDTTVQNNPAGGVLVASTGDLYVTGITLVTGNAIGLIRKSRDGSSWSLLKEASGIGSSLAIAPDGTFFASGGAGGGRVVQRSKDGGMTWQPVDTVTYADATACNTGWVAVDSKGVVYSAGSCDSEGWIVRRSTNGGDSWTSLGSPYLLMAGHLARLADLHIDGADRVFVSGTAQDANSVSHWVVRRLGAGDAWTTVDDYQLEANASGGNPRLTGTKRLYAVGSMDTATAKHWIIRRAPEGGGTWATIDDFTQSGATYAGADGVYEGPGGRLVAVGAIEDAANGRRTITRRSNDDGVTWTGTENWAYSPGKASQPNELAADSKGNVYGTARGVDANNRAHWLVRKLACSP